MGDACVLACVGLGCLPALADGDLVRRGVSWALPRFVFTFGVLLRLADASSSLGASAERGEYALPQPASVSRARARALCSRWG